MFLLSKVATSEQQAQFLQPLRAGTVQSVFMMSEPAEDDGAGSDPSMLKTTAELDGEHWVINGRKCFSSGLLGAKVGILMAKTQDLPRDDVSSSSCRARVSASTRARYDRFDTAGRASHLPDRKSAGAPSRRARRGRTRVQVRSGTPRIGAAHAPVRAGSGRASVRRRSPRNTRSSARLSARH